MTDSRRLRRHKGRRAGFRFIQIPHPVMRSRNWMECRPTAAKLLLDIALQYNGHNNGDLCAAPTILKPRGWRPATVTAALKELCHYGLLIQTRQGGLHQCNLYALSWQPIDDCAGKHDSPPTTSPPNDWQTDHGPYVRPPRKKSPVRKA